MKNFYTLLCCLLLAANSIFAQTTVTKAWDARFSGVDGYGGGGFAVDGHRHIFTAGMSLDNLGNLNPTVIMYDSLGNQLWVASFSYINSNSTVINGVAIDSQCNAYISGRVYQGVDEGNSFIAKVNGSGVFQWVYDLPDLRSAQAMVFDNNCLYIAGHKFITDGNGNTLRNIGVAKYSPTGQQLWFEHVEGGSDEFGINLAADNSGNISVTGVSNDANGKVILTAKFDASGNQLWAQSYAAPVTSFEGIFTGFIRTGFIKVAPDNSFIVTHSITGISDADILLLKYDAAGNFLWSNVYGENNGSDDYIRGLVTNSAGIYFAGITVNILSGSSDLFTTSFAQQGSLQWNVLYNGPDNLPDEAYDLTLDPGGNIYTCGAGGSNAGSMDYITLKYNPSGQLQWEQRYDGADHRDDFSLSIKAPFNDVVYVTGLSVSSSVPFEFTTVKYNQQQLTPNGSACSTAISITPENTCNPTAITMSGNEMWYSFVADSASVNVVVNNIGSISKVNKLTAYENNCSSLSSIADIYHADSPDNILLSLSGLTTGNSYFIKAEKNETSDAPFEICLENALPDPPFFNYIGSFEACGLKYKQKSIRLNQRVTNTTQAGESLPAVFDFSNDISNDDILLKAYICFTALKLDGTFGPVPLQFTTSTGLHNINVYPQVTTKDGNGTCWGNTSTYDALDYTAAYFHDVTPYMPTSDINTSYTISGLPIGANYDVNGLSLLIVYKEPCAEPFVTRPSKLTLWQGLDVYYGTTTYTMGTSSTGGGFTAYQNNANPKLFLIVSDIENDQSEWSSPLLSINFPFGEYMYSFNEAVTALNPGQTTVQYTVHNDGYDCYAVSVFGVYTKDGNSFCPVLSAADAGPDKTICSGNSVTIGANPPISGGSTPYTYTWSPSIGLSSSSVPDPTVTLSNNTSSVIAQAYTLVVTDANGCSKTDEVTITVYPAPTVNLLIVEGCQQNGGSISALPAGGTSPYSYLWSPSAATTQDITGLASGNYRVTVTDINGCQAISNLTTLNVLPTPTVTINSTDYCKGTKTLGTATATATGGSTPYTYLWNNGSTMQTITALIAGNYIVTVSGANGCTGTATTAIVENAVAPPVITGNNNDCTPGMNTYSVAPAAGLSFSFSVTNGSPASCTNCTSIGVTWNIPANGTGKIVATATDNSTGCQSTLTLIVFPCCVPSGITIHHNLSNRSALTGTPVIANLTGLNILINGTFVVDDNVTFNNCQVYLGPDAKIEVMPGKSLAIAGQSKLQATCNIMWDGIFVKPNGTLRILGATIQDAKNAVVEEVSIGANSIITAAVFDKNYKDIILKSFSGAYPGSITGSILTCSGALLPFNMNNVLTNASRTAVGIEITDVNSINIGSAASAKNTIEKMDFGIVSINSSVTIKNNDFKDITFKSLPCNLPGPCLQNPGIAIWAKGNKTVSRTLTLGGPGIKDKNTIKNCAVGIKAEDHTHLNAEANLFTNEIGTGILGSLNPSTGIIVQNCQQRNILIKKNTFTKYKTGISCRLMTLSNVTIDLNTMFNTYNVPAAATAIKVQDAFVIKSQGFTYVTSNKVKGAGTGIFISGTGLAQVKNNTITFAHLPNANAPAKVHYGIRITGGDFATIEQNTVERTGQNPSLSYNTKLFGVSIETSPVANVISNNFSKLGAGVRFFNTFAQSYLQCNIMQNCQRGVTLENSDIQDQGTFNQPQDNRWVYQGGFNREADVLGVNSPILNRIWTVRDLNLPWGPDVINFINPTGVAIPVLGNSQSPINCTNPCNPVVSPCKQAPLIPVAQNQAPFNSFAPEAQFLARQSAFEQLRNEPGLMQLGTADDAVLQQFHNNTLQANTGKIHKVKEHISNNDLFLAKQENDFISSSNLMEENHKKINDVYLRSWAVNQVELESSDRSTLEAIANQNPMNGGKAVYSARTMLDITLDDFAPEQSARMAAPKLEINNETLPSLLQKQAFVGRVYPNPNDGKMQIDYQLNEGQRGVFIIYDVLGQREKYYLMPDNRNTLKISEAALKNGIYFYEIWVNDEVIISDKIIIIK